MKPTIHYSSSDPENVPKNPRPTWGQVGLNSLLIVGSIRFASVSYPAPICSLFIGLGMVSLLCIVLKTGWTSPMTILGVYVGIVLDAHVKSGSADAQIMETVRTIATSTGIGLFFGLLIDWQSHQRPRPPGSELE